MADNFFDLETFNLYSLKASSSPSGINTGNWMIPNSNQFGVPTGNCVPYVIKYMPGSQLLSVSVQTGTTFINLGGIADSATTRRVRNEGEFYGIQFDYPRAISFLTEGASPSATVQVSFIDCNNYKNTETFVGNGSANVNFWGSHGINILNSLSVTVTTPTTVIINLTNRFELPYADLFAPVNSVNSYCVEMITVARSTDDEDAINGLWISTYQNNAPYLMRIEPSVFLPNVLQFERPVVDFLSGPDPTPKLPEAGSTVVFWQTIYPYYSEQANKGWKCGTNLADRTVSLQYYYQTGEAIYGTKPNPTNWVGWKG